MLPSIASLLQLQERDQRLRGLTKDLKDVPVLQQRAKLQLADDTAATEAALTGVREIEVKIKNVEIDIQTRQNTIKRLQDQQFETRKNEEFQALGNEVIRYQNEVRGLEDKEIEFMEQLEAAKEVHKAAAAKLAATTARVNEEIAQLEERGINLKARIDEITADRATLAAAVDSGDLSLYDRLMKSKGNAAVVPVENGICGGCHMKLVTATLTELKANDHLVHCEQCGRVLYFA
ncbi:MAG: hypothetical protein JNJ83_20130 [Verrucomicrobiaceae bacterium]|nr:hypothetical protein [Verrucomicrobiaceae bacterium]